MVDITMCSNIECPLRHTCYRHTAVASKWQSQSLFKYELDCVRMKVWCEHFIDNNTNMARDGKIHD